MVMLVERRFLPGATALATVRVANTGNVPTTFIVEISPGSSPPIGPFIAEGVPVRIITPIVRPGGDVAVRIPVSLSDIEGPKEFQVRIGQAGPTGGFLNLLDSQVFEGLARIEALDEIPGPDDIIPGDGPGVIRTREELAQAFSVGLGTPRLSLTDADVERGEVIHGRILIPSTSGIPFAPLLEVNVAIVDPLPPFDVQELLTVLGPLSLSLSADQPITESFSINTAGLPAPDTGSLKYDVRIVLLDTVTGILLLDFTVQDVIRIRAPAIPVPPDEGPEPPIEKPVLPAPQPGLGDLDSVARITPNTVEQGEAARLTYAVFNRTTFDITTIVGVWLVPDSGPGIVSLVAPRTITIEEDSQRAGGASVPTAQLRPGTYGVRLLGTVVGTGAVVLDETIPNLLTVEGAPFIPEEPVPPGLIPGQFTLTTQAPGSPQEVIPGETATVKLQFRAAEVDLPVSPEITLELRVQNSFGTTIETLPTQSVRARLGGTTDVNVSWPIPTGTPVARYGLRVDAFDPNTEAQGFLVQESLFPLWEVVIPAAAISIDFPGVRVTPSAALAFQVATFQVVLVNNGARDARVSVAARLINPNGRPGSNILFTTISVPALDSTTVSQGFRAPELQGNYDILVTVIESGTGNVLINTTVTDVFSVVPLGPGEDF